MISIWNPKTWLLASLLIGNISFCQADTLGLKGGVSYWRAELTGEALNRKNKNAKQKPLNLNELKLTHENYNSVWFEFEHPIPVLPNLRLNYTNIESNKKITQKIVQNLGEGTQLTFYQKVDTAIAFNSLDATLYYELLDNWVNIDVGLTARKLDGYLDMVYYDTPLATPRSLTKLDETIPMLYLKTEFEIPTTGAYVMALINGISYQGDTFYDGEIKIGYNFDFIPGFEFGVASGYRMMQLQTINISNLYADAQMEGWQIEVTAHF